MTLTAALRLFPLGLVLTAGLWSASAPVADAQVPALRQAVAETAARDDDLAAFYRARDFAPVWAGSDAAAVNRRNALLGAMAEAPVQGLPASRFDPEGLMARLRAATTVEEQGRMDVEMSRAFLDYARAVQTGLLDPHAVIPLIHRDVPEQDRRQLLERFLRADPVAFLRALPPSTPEYVRLLRAKLDLEALIPQGGWGPTVPAGSYAPGASGDGIVALRNRLVAMGYLERTTTRTYDAGIVSAVRAFQEAHGIEPDGVAGNRTLAAINIAPEERLRAVLVAMERERWLGEERGDRHVWVNLVTFTAQIVDHDRVTFETRSVIGANSADRQTPEFSDVMEHMVINPSWYVPRSIVVNEYLPALRRNSGAAGHLQIINQRGQVVGRGQSFANYSSASFPYSMRQPPGPGNALGRVKFMFPNPYNIYLHDTPSRGLFSETVRTFSHGCIRLNDPLDFAYRLLEGQTDDPEEFFGSRLRSGAETRVDLDTPIPVHLDYRTAFTDVDGTVEYRDDVYGRDARIWQALAEEGVQIPDVQG